MPIVQKKKTRTPKEVPEPGDPDRKRVLNVLAQRRYRERRKAKLAKLEAQAQGAITPATTPASANETHEKRSTCPATAPQLGGMTGLPQSTSASPLDESELIEEIIRYAMPQEYIGFPPMDFNQDVFDTQLLEDINSVNPPIGIPSSSSLARGSTPAFSSSSSSSPCPMSLDGSQLEVPCLSATRAFTTIAHLLGIINKVWDPLYLHTVQPMAPPNVPPNLHPTTAQMTIPHHPFLDALPWPSVREKLICMLSLPSACRPPIARDDDLEGPGRAIMRLVLDLDDHSEGVRIHGNLVGWGAGSELAEEAWEIGEQFYRNWWWCLDGKIISITNRRRRERGVGPLTKMYELE